MKKVKILILIVIVFVIPLSGQEIIKQNSLLTETNMEFLKEMTKDVMESSRIYPGQKISDEFGRISSGLFLSPILLQF